MNVKTPRNGAKPVDKVMILKQNAKFFPVQPIPYLLDDPTASLCCAFLYLSIYLYLPANARRGRARGHERPSCVRVASAEPRGGGRRCQ